MGSRAATERAARPETGVPMRSVCAAAPQLAGVVPYDPKYLPATAVLSANENPHDVDDEIRRDIMREVKRLPLNRYPDPLANDLPGSDPRTADARLTLGGDITPKANLKVTTDQRSGLVTVIATRPGPYFLDYVAAFGSARVDRSQIRVDVAKDAAGFVPQTMPDQAAIRGTNPVRVDVLANDADPNGRGLRLTAVDAAPAGMTVKWLAREGARGERLTAEVRD